jgi:hypothetical protein
MEKPPSPHPYVDQFDFEGVSTVRMPIGNFDGTFRRALFDNLPAGTIFRFNREDSEVWVEVSRPGDTRRIVTAALESIGRDLPDQNAE